MKKWTRWQDWVALVAGAYAILSPLWTTTVAAATGTLILLGIIIALAAVASLAEPDAVLLQPLVAAIGAVVFVSPWVMGSARRSAWPGRRGSWAWSPSSPVCWRCPQATRRTTACWRRSIDADPQRLIQPR